MHNMKIARFISFFVGFCSLSLEIAWVRLYGFANFSTPKAFAYILAVYLLGIACGAQIGKFICQRQPLNKIKRTAVYVLLVGSLIAVFSPWIYLYSKLFFLDDVLSFVGIFATAGSLSILFPITHHLGTFDDDGKELEEKKGSAFSRVYILNVIGASLGPIVTGYVFLEYLSISQVFFVIGGVIALIAVYAVFFIAIKNKSRLMFSSIASVVLIFCIFSYWIVKFPNKMAEKFSMVGDENIVAIHENRHGIITISRKVIHRKGFEPFEDFSVYGGNVYDGKTNLNLERNTNGLERPLALHVLQPKAKRVLILGLSIGSWLTVVEGFPGIESIDVVEINSGYLELAKKYDAQRRALSDKRVNLIIDDARRWLRFNHGSKYDIILMNTTWHWRANSSMLLSKEMMILAKAHLNEHGILAFNATGSIDAFFTAASVFQEARKYENFVFAANWSFMDAVNDKIAWEVLRNVTIDGKNGFSEKSKKIEEFSKIPFISMEQNLKEVDRMPEIITDDNMLVEYKYGRNF